MVAGYPCCSISGQNNQQKSFTDKESSTGSGFHATKKYVSNNKSLEWILLENVQGMFYKRSKFGNECPMDVQTAWMKKQGFECAFSLLINSSEYGLPQSRARAYVLYIRVGSMKHFT